MKVYVVIMHTEFYDYNTLCDDTIRDIFQNEEDAKKRVRDTLIEWGVENPTDIQHYVRYWCPDTHACDILDDNACIYYEEWEVK